MRSSMAFAESTPHFGARAMGRRRPDHAEHRNTPLRRFMAIVAGSVGLACLLGICIDLVTANVAVDYFSVHHPRLIPTDNPWVLAVAWGIVASW